MGSKRTARDKAWAKDGRISSPFEPPVEGYFRGALEGSNKKITDRTPGNDQRPQIRAAPVLHTEDKILCEAYVGILTHVEEEALPEIAHMLGMKQKSIGKRIDEMVEGGLIVRIGDRLALTESGKEFLLSPEEWRRKRYEKESAMILAVGRREAAHALKRAERDLDVELDLMDKNIDRIRVPSKQKAEDLTKKVMQLSAETAGLEQPMCWLVPDYDLAFEAFSAKVETLISRNADLRRSMHSCLQAREYVELAKTQMDTLKELIAETESKQISQKQKWKIRSRLLSRQSLIQDLESFIKETPEAFWRLQEMHDEITRALSELRQSTHQWEAIKHENVTIKPAQPPREDSSIVGSQPQVESTYATEWKCRKCGKETDRR